MFRDGAPADYLAPVTGELLADLGFTGREDDFDWEVLRGRQAEAGSHPGHGMMLIVIVARVGACGMTMAISFESINPAALLMRTL